MELYTAIGIILVGVLVAFVVAGFGGSWKFHVPKTPASKHDERHCFQKCEGALNFCGVADKSCNHQFDRCAARCRYG